MSTERTPELLKQDRGLDASSEDYPHVVRSVLLAPWVASGVPLPDQATQLAARTVAALNEVAFWANDGQSADPTACAWLSYLRWAQANGARLPADAPHPPADDFARLHPVLAGQGEHSGDSFEALATGGLGEVARPVLPLADSPEVLARTAPYGLLPNIGWKSLVALTVDSAAITHGSPEAQTAATGLALAVHAAARARAVSAPLSAVVAETARVCSLVTRPAPQTLELLAQCADPAARRDMIDDAAAGNPSVTASAASSALALGLAALLHAESTSGPAHPEAGNDIARRAALALPCDGAVPQAARAAAFTVAAARWGLEEATDAGSKAQSSGSGAEATRAELLSLAGQWTGCWCP